ncbi:MOP flippase family protein [Formosa haliotis]|uniref:MOP flippase family protein n=1 Tax=Formosa haliotis TaxID=1555194 RepID=UPI000827081B|nr:MOP flippase family protein [Formosa haliotis]
MSVKKQAISGVKWTTVSTITLAVSALLKISVLARFLDPSAFGLMAIITFVLGFMDLFMDMGITSAILHKQDIKKEEYASLYWLNVMFSVLLFVLIVLLSPFIASFYSENELLKLIPLAGVIIIFSALGRQFKTILQKELQFKLMAIVDICSALLALIFAIILAINDYGIYALVYAALVQYGLNNILYLVIGIKHNPIVFHFNYQETKPFLKIGIYQVGGQVVNYFNRDLDILIIGKFFGTDILGGYSLAKQLVLRPTQILNPIITKVASPVLAKFQRDIILLKDNYLKLLKIVSSLNTPIYLGLIVFAPFVIDILYGSNFLHITSLVRILCIYMLIRAVGNPIGSLVIATGRTDLEFFWNVLNLVIMPLSVIIGAQFSLEGVAISITIAMLVMLIPSWYFLVYKLTNASLKEYLNALIPSVMFLKKAKQL